MANDGFTTVRIRNRTWVRLHNLARQAHRTLGLELDYLVDKEHLEVVAVKKLGYSDAHGEPIPLVEVVKVQP